MPDPTESEVYQFESFRIDGGKRLLWNGGEPLTLTPRVFDTLFYLVRNAGQTVGKDELMAAIWPGTVVEENNLNKNISALRQTLGEKPGNLDSAWLYILPCWLAAVRRIEIRPSH